MEFLHYIGTTELFSDTKLFCSVVISELTGVQPAEIPDVVWDGIIATIAQQKEEI